MVVEIIHGDVERSSIAEDEGEGLVERIKGLASHDDVMKAKTLDQVPQSWREEE